MAMKDEDLSGLSAQEREFVESMEDDEEMAAAMGRDLPDDDDGDDDEDLDTKGNEDKDDDEDKDDGDADDDKGDDADAGSDSKGDEDKPEPQPKPEPEPESAAPVLERRTPTDANEQRQALLTERSDALRKLIDGEMEAEEYAKIDAEVQQKLDAIVRAESIDQAREQIARDTMMADYNKQLSATLKRGVEAGLEGLSDPKSDVAKAFDRAVRMFGQDAVERGLSDEPGKLAASKDALEEALAYMLRRHGKTETRKAGAEDQAATAKPTAKPRQPVDRSTLPPTLAAVPVAADAAVGGGEFAHLNGLEGAALERAIAKLSEEQLERYLD